MEMLEACVVEALEKNPFPCLSNLHLLMASDVSLVPMSASSNASHVYTDSPVSLSLTRTVVSTGSTLVGQDDLLIPKSAE